jgi:hypothetical protein
MCINFYIQHRIFKRRRIDCHTADGVTTTALASAATGRRRSGRPAASATRPDRGRTRRCCVDGCADAADPRQEMPATTRGERQRKRSPKPNDISRPPLPAAPPAWRSVRYTFTLECGPTTRDPAGVRRL